jgi:hypothetical protein
MQFFCRSAALSTGAVSRYNKRYTWTARAWCNTTQRRPNQRSPNAAQQHIRRSELPHPTLCQRRAC